MNTATAPTATAVQAPIARKLSDPCFATGVMILTLSFTLHQLVDYSSWEFFHLNVFGLISGVLGGAGLSVAMLLPFLIIKATKARQSRSRGGTILWLLSPAVLMTAIVIGSAVWKCQPEQRLRVVAGGKVERASNIRTARFWSFTAGSWLAICHTDEAAYLSFCKAKGLEPFPTIAMLDVIRRRSLVRSSAIVASLPESSSTALQHGSFDDDGRSGCYFLYDRAFSTMVVYRYFHD